MEGNFVPLLFGLMFSFLHLLCLRHLGIPGEQNRPIACRLEKDLGGHPHPNCNYHCSPPQLPSQPYVYIAAYLYICWGHVAVGPCFSGRLYPLTVVKIGQVDIHLASSVFISELLEKLICHFLL